MNIISAHSIKESVDDVIKDLKEQFKGIDTKMMVYYASSMYAPDTLSKKMQEAFPAAEVFGCTTAGEITSGKMLKNSVVAMAFNAQAIKDVKVEVVEDVKDVKGVEKAFASFEKHFGIPMLEMNPKRFVGIVLVDGLSGAEENLIEKIGDMTDITFIGGSAGDDLKFVATHVYANGKSYTDAAVLALLKPGVEFSFIKTQSFNVLPKKLVVTKANAERREVLEFNNKPAATAYAEALGIAVEDAPDTFMHNPVGLVIDGEPYVRSPQQIKDNKMLFYCSVVEGMELSILESTNIIDDTKKAIEDVKSKLGSISGIINFNCILRTLELGQKHLKQDYGKLFSDVPTAGFSTYGEQYIGHINQTATMLVFK
jgi:hypothetical protein